MNFIEILGYFGCFFSSNVRIPMYAVLTTVCALGSLVLLLLPQPRQVPVEINVSVDRPGDPSETSNILQSSGNHPSSSSHSFDSPEEHVKTSPPQSPTIKSIIARSIALSRTPTMLALLAATAFTGVNLTFYSGVFGTCLSRMQQFGKSAKSYIGLSGIFIGLGEIIGSQITLLGNRIRPGGVLCIGFVAALAGQLMAFLMIPPGAPVGTTSEIAFIQPTVYMAMTIAFLLGIVDSVWNTQISALIGRIYPDASQNTAAAFALYKFAQSVASAIAFFYSPHLLLHWQVLILAVTATLGAFCFIVVERRCTRRQPVV
uniref:UNC93-like protein MFSD11 n=1 Tax=Schistocephalus solidus TaxID=70667 RepID=A0A0X3PMP0_SCHSO